MLLMVGSVITGTYTFINDLAGETAYNVDVDQQYLDDFNNTRALSTQINNSYKEIVAINHESQGTIQFFTSLPKVLNIITNMIAIPFTIVGEIIDALERHLGIPTWVTIFMIAVITVYLLFAIISLVLRYNA